MNYYATLILYNWNLSLF